MTNSTNNNFEELSRSLEAQFEVINVEQVAVNQFSFDFNENQIHGALSYVKNLGYTQLSMVLCVDFLEEGVFQLVYLVFDWKKGIRLQIRTKINREASQFRTITSIYPGAMYYEREIHEFFGVHFEGNPNSEKQLFLENWDDMPPMRKDFDSQAYSDRKYTRRTYTKDFNSKEVQS